MSSYSRIESQFLKVGHKESDLLSELEFNKALDKIGKSNTGLNEFDRSVAQQLFEQVQKDKNDKAKVKDYIEIILKAHEMLKKNIGILREQVQLDKSRKNNKILEELFQFQEDLRLLTIPFGLPEPNKIPELQGYADNSQLIVTERSINPDITTEESKYEGIDIIVIFIVACLWLLLDLISALSKPSFLNMLAPLAILGIFLLKCFDKHYVRMCITGIVVSMILDLIWLLSMSKTFWNPTNPSHRSPKNEYLYRMAVIFTIILMVFRIVLMILIYPYRHNPPETKKTVKFDQIQLQLTGKPHFNPLAHLFTSHGEVFGLK